VIPRADHRLKLSRVGEVPNEIPADDGRIAKDHVAPRLGAVRLAARALRIPLAVRIVNEAEVKVGRVLFQQLGVAPVCPFVSRSSPQTYVKVINPAPLPLCNTE
jgi:hypothetical protein